MKPLFKIHFKSGDRYPQQFELDPRYRHTFWALAIGNSTGGTLASYVCQQYKVQRYLSCKSLKEAQKSTFLAAIGIVFISLLGLIQNLALKLTLQREGIRITSNELK